MIAHAKKIETQFIVPYEHAPQLHTHIPPYFELDLKLVSLCTDSITCTLNFELCPLYWFVLLLYYCIRNTQTPPVHFEYSYGQSHLATWTCIQVHNGQLGWDSWSTCWWIPGQLDNVVGESWTSCRGSHGQLVLLGSSIIIKLVVT